jgi:Ca2+-binding EF-hand superfamily protein
MRYLLCCIVLICCIAIAAADKAKSEKDSTIADQAKQVFDKYDTNKDDFLDKAELAKMFRGSGAKPPAEKKSESKKDEKKSDKPEKLLPDEEFLQKWDKNGDEKLSRNEFEAAYKDYVQHLEKEAKQAQRQMQQQSGHGHGHSAMQHMHPRIH